MYGPATDLFMRVASKDNLLNGLPVKEGTYVSIQHLGNHYSEKYFKDPLVFRP
jgi:cytochrome P450